MSVGVLARLSSHSNSVCEYRSRVPCVMMSAVERSKPNRLRRSFKRTQQTQSAGEEVELNSPQGKPFDFKTPTRPPRGRVAAVFCSQSPSNEAELQQDIIWDATSPSPNRLGKRGKKQPPPGAVNISEIVNRIAPKHGRPKASEPSIQQWIGDSVSIPCTPDTQQPKAKKKSPRPNGVDDLLKLAQQFDFNMFRQEEEEEEKKEGNEAKDEGEIVEMDEDMDLFSDHFLEPENVPNRVDVSLPLPGKPHPSVRTEPLPKDEQRDEQNKMEDDLDFLFDGPTQNISGNLSQAFSQLKPSAPKITHRISSSSSSSSSASVFTSTKSAQQQKKEKPVHDAFEDDWENDDLLDDSLVLEMTQNPQDFAAPKHTSTQKLALNTPRRVKKSPRQSPITGGNNQPMSSKVGTTTFRQRATFKLDPNPNSMVRMSNPVKTEAQQQNHTRFNHQNEMHLNPNTSATTSKNPNSTDKRIHTDTWTNAEVDRGLRNTNKSERSSSDKAGLSEKLSTQHSWKTHRSSSDNLMNSNTQNSQFNQRTSSSSYKKLPSETNPNFPQRAQVAEKQHFSPEIEMKSNAHNSQFNQITQSTNLSLKSNSLASATALRFQQRAQQVAQNHHLSSDNIVKSNPQSSQFKQSTFSSSSSSSSSTHPGGKFTNTSPPMKPHTSQFISRTLAPGPAPQSFPQKVGTIPPVEADFFLEEDLNSFFECDPVWDDPADDDLLCGMCEDLESQIYASNQPTSNPPNHPANNPANVTRSGGRMHTDGRSNVGRTSKEIAAMNPDNKEQKQHSVNRQGYNVGQLMLQTDTKKHQQQQTFNEHNVPQKQSHMLLKPAVTSAYGGVGSAALRIFNHPNKGSCNVGHMPKGLDNKKHLQQTFNELNFAQNQSHMPLKSAVTFSYSNSEKAGAHMTGNPTKGCYNVGQLPKEVVNKEPMQQQSFNLQNLPQMPLKPAVTFSYSDSEKAGAHTVTLRNASTDTHTDSFPKKPPTQVNGAAAAASTSSRRDVFTFKKPSGPVTTATNSSSAGKCTEAEIERKKQQALEKRRQRQLLTANQNLP